MLNMNFKIACAFGVDEALVLQTLWEDEHHTIDSFALRDKLRFLTIESFKTTLKKLQLACLVEEVHVGEFVEAFYELTDFGKKVMEVAMKMETEDGD